METVSRLSRRLARWRLERAFARFQSEHPLAADEHGLLLQHGVGDHFIAASLATAIASSHGGKVVLAGRPEMAFLADLFRGVSRYVVLPGRLRGQELGLRDISAGRWVFAHFRGMELARAVGYRGFTLVDAYRCLFGLAPSARPEEPRQPTVEEMENARAFAARAGIDLGRAVYVCGDSRSTPVGPDLAGRIEAFSTLIARRGLQVAGNRLRLGEGQAETLVPLAMLRPLIAAARGHVMARSGLADLAAGLSTPGCVLYPQARYLGGNLLDGTSLRAFEFAACPSEMEEPSLDALTAWFDHHVR